MAIFAALGAAALANGALWAAAGYYAASAVVTMGINRLMTKRALKKANAGSEAAGGRIQLPPATDNKLPVVYGSAFVSGPIIDAYLTTDQKTMYYVIALTEKTDIGTISFGDIYYDGKKVTFASDGAGGTTRVASLTTNNSGTSQVDTRVAGNIFIYLYNDGSGSPTNTPLSAYSVMPNWTSNNKMTNAAFAIVKINYNVDAGTTNLGALMAQVRNTETGQATGVYRPGTAIKDYMLNTVYGCALPASKVDTDSLNDLNTYSDETITYINANGIGTSTQARYRVNGPIDTAQNCLNNLQDLVDTCDSWLQYSEMNGLWRVIVNKPIVGDPFEVTSSNIVGGIQVSPLDLNETFNELEVAYPNLNIKDQTDYQVLFLDDYQSTIMSPNEAVNRLNINFPLVNNAVQAKYLGVRRLLQSREDLTISFNLDFSGIQLEAGDVISVTHEVYGWVDKLFRVSQVVEQQQMDGTLGVSITAFEYNETIYDDNSIQNFIPAFNTGLLDPNVFDAPSTPIITNGPVGNGTTTSFNVSSNVPPNGAIIYMDFNYGNSSNTQQHLLYRTVQASTGTTLTPSGTITINVNDIAPGSLWWSATARNDFAGRTSNASNQYGWVGPGVTTYNPNTGIGGITEPFLGADVRNNFAQLNSDLANNTAALNNLNSNTLPALAADLAANDAALNTLNTVTLPALNAELANNQVEIDQNANAIITLNTVTLPALTANLAATNIVLANNTVAISTLNNTTIPALNSALANNTTKTNQNANSIQTLNITTIPALSSNLTLLSNELANLEANVVFPITSTQISDSAITTPKIAAGAVVASSIAAGAIVAGKIGANAITAQNIQAGAITALQIATGTITADKIGAGEITTTLIAANSITSAQIAAGTITASDIAAGTITANQIAAGTITSSQIAAGTITAMNIQAGTFTANNLAAGSITSDKIAAGAVTATKIAAGAVTASSIAAGSVTTNAIAAGAITANEIGAGAITATKIGASAVTAFTIAANAVTTNSINAGAITAAKLGAGEIITNSAQIADAIIIGAKIANLSVDTLKIAGGAVFIPAYASAYSGFVTFNTSYSTMLSGSITISGMPAGATCGVIITGVVSLYPQNGDGTSFTLAAFNGATEIGSTGVSVRGDSVSCTVVALGTVSNGTYTFYLKGKVGAPGVSSKSLSYNVSGTLMAGKR